MQSSLASKAAAIEIEALSHRYPQSSRDALSNIAFTVEPGTRVGLLGPNGAGKSTLMRILCGYLPVQRSASVSGAARVRVAGSDVATESLTVRRQVGYMPELVPLYPELRVREHLAFRAALKGVRRRHRAEEIERVAGLTGILDQLIRPIGHLSRGYRQRVGLADALLGDPAVVVLDEPTVGLDPNQVQEIRAMLRAMQGRQTLVFSSHILAEVEMLCDRVIILSEGKLVADEATAEAMRAGQLRVAWSSDATLVRPIVERWRLALPQPLLEDALHWITTSETTTEVAIALPGTASVDVDGWMASLGKLSLDEGLALRKLEAGRSRLEERFAAVTGGQRA